MYFLIHYEYGVEFSYNRVGCFGNLYIVENFFHNFFVCSISRLVFTAFLHSNRGDVSSFARKFFSFAVFPQTFFLLLVRAVCFDRVYLVKQDLFLQSRLYVEIIMEISLELNEVYKLNGLGLILSKEESYMFIICK